MSGCLFAIKFEETMRLNAKKAAGMRRSKTIKLPEEKHESLTKTTTPDTMGVKGIVIQGLKGYEKKND